MAKIFYISSIKTLFVILLTLNVYAASVDDGFIKGVPPQGRLFDPLIADPRWPHFSITYQYYIDNEELESVGATSFGETLNLYSGNAFYAGCWQIGIQAAVFAIFDLDAESKDLINADYWVGIPISYRKGNFSSLFRIFHQSSHLGDEYLLRKRVDRVNLSYESLDLKLSYDINNIYRVYAGSGFLFNQDPSDIDKWSAQSGFELKSPKTYLSGLLRPIAGIDLKAWEENDWSIDVSSRIGFQMEGKKTAWQKLQIMLEYLKGHSPNGQFFERSIEFIGIGTHLYF